MAKYTNTAGFKAISNENTEEPNEKLPRALLFLIIGGIVVVVFIVFLMCRCIYRLSDDSRRCLEP